MKNIVNKKAYSFPELILVIALVGILAGTLIPKVTQILDNVYNEGTKKEMNAIRKAILGDRREGLLGYYDTVGSWPPDIDALLSKPAGVLSFDPYTQIGWNGPYVGKLNRDSIAGEADIKKDVWGHDYEITTIGGKHALLSYGANGIDEMGGSDDIVIYLE